MSSKDYFGFLDVFVLWVSYLCFSLGKWLGGGYSDNFTGREFVF